VSALVRAGLAGFGILLMLAGIAVIGAVPAVGAIPGLELVGFGAFLVIVVAIERQRYRSEAAEAKHETPGPGGGEPAGVAVEARFRRTNEAFVDPTTGITMRVAVDPATGERRYVAEG